MKATAAIIVLPLRFAQQQKAHPQQQQQQWKQPQTQSLPLPMKLKMGWRTHSFACIVHWRELHSPSIEALNLWLTGRLADWLIDWVAEWMSECRAFHSDWYALIYILYYLHKLRKFSKNVSTISQVQFPPQCCCCCCRQSCCCCCCCWKAIKADSAHCWLANRTAARQRMNSIKFPAIA